MPMRTRSKRSRRSKIRKTKKTGSPRRRWRAAVSGAAMWIEMLPVTEWPVAKWIFFEEPKPCKVAARRGITCQLYYPQKT
jgi:hypothetical protein